jgi:hypothetical protein
MANTTTTMMTIQSQVATVILSFGMQILRQADPICDARAV